MEDDDSGLRFAHDMQSNNAPNARETFILARKSPLISKREVNIDQRQYLDRISIEQSWSVYPLLNRFRRSVGQYRKP